MEPELDYDLDLEESHPAVYDSYWWYAPDDDDEELGDDGEPLPPDHENENYWREKSEYYGAYTHRESPDSGDGECPFSRIVTPPIGWFYSSHLQRRQAMSYTQAKSDNAPTRPGAWSLSQIVESLSKPLPKNLLESKKVGGMMISYIPWHKAVLVLDKYAPGWAWEVRTIHTTDKDLFLIGRLTIPTSDGLMYREATGTNSLTDTAYGDASSNAESMAFRRAAAKFGLALYLYDK